MDFMKGSHAVGCIFKVMLACCNHATNYAIVLCY